jgi:hypothetical protein
VDYGGVVIVNAVPAITGGCLAEQAACLSVLETSGAGNGGSFCGFWLAGHLPGRVNECVVVKSPVEADGAPVRPEDRGLRTAGT